MRLIRISFSRTTPESVEYGDFSETGWINEQGLRMEPDGIDRDDGLTAVDLAVRLLKNAGASNPSSTMFHPSIWYSTGFHIIDYPTGTDEEHSYHLERFTIDEERAIFDRVTSNR